jgi:hypothetical protein
MRYLLICAALYGDTVSLDFSIQRSLDNVCGESARSVGELVLSLQAMEAQLALEYAESPYRVNQDEGKQIINLPSFILKKRYSENTYHEMLAWEIGRLMHLERYLIPSYLINVDGCPMTVQPRLSFAASNRLMEPSDCHKKMSLEDFWMGNILLFLLGSMDITGRNMGFDPEDFHPIYFDLEHSFCINNYLKMTPIPNYNKLKYRIDCFYCPMNLRGYLFGRKLNKNEVDSLNFYQSQLDEEFLQKLIYYLIKNKYLNFAQKQSFLERLEKIRGAYFYEGLSFSQFLIYLFPDLPSTYSDHFRKIYQLLEWDFLGFSGAMFWMIHLQDDWIQEQSIYKKINVILDELYLDMMAK